MSSIARHIIKGPAAYLIVMRARKISESSGKAIYHLDNDPLLVAVYDSRAETLVVFDDAGLVALAAAEVSCNQPIERTGGIDVVA